jgi:hypothetical protein
VRWTVYGLFASTMLAAHPGAGQQATHLRAVDPNISPLIALGIERSATFRQLVHAIDSHDSYVYVKEGRCGAGAPACFAGVTAAGSTRFIWVKVDLRAHSRQRDRNERGCRGRASYPQRAARFRTPGEVNLTYLEIFRIYASSLSFS